MRACFLSPWLDVHGYPIRERGNFREIALDRAGAFVIVPKGTWHTARADGHCEMLFITAGEGTRHRPAGGDKAG